MMIQSSKKIKILIGTAIGAFALLCVFFTPVYTKVSFEYAEDPKGEIITTVFAGMGDNITAGDAKNRVVSEGVANIAFLDVQYGNHCSIKRIDPMDQYYKAEMPLKIGNITIRQNGIRTISISGEEISEYFEVNSDIQLLESEDGTFTFMVTGEDPQLLPNESFQKSYTSFRLPVIVMGFLLFGALLTGLCFLFYWFSREMETNDRLLRVSYYIFLGSLLMAAGLCVYVGLRSPFWMNPDEYDVKAAVIYYFTYWMPPDIRSDIINDSFPVYGTSRHFEFNMFYFYTGKIGQFFQDTALQLRWLNLCLFGIMTGMVIRNFKRHFSLLSVLLLTPQIWYIFSYSTADAMDFFVGFLCLYELIEKDSMLNRLLKEPFQKIHMLYYGILSVLFVHVMWAKPTFYTVLIFLFLILLIRLIDTEKPLKAALLRKYLILVGLTLVIFVTRYMITDYKYYGFDKYGAMIEVTERRADYGYKPSTPPLEQADSMSFYGKGITIKEFYQNFEFHKNLYRTFAGFFGSYAFGGADWYYYAMGGLYAVLMLWVLYQFYRMKSRKKMMELAAVLFVCLIQYLLIVYNAYVIDFQPQGRYLLPILLFIAYLFHACEGARESKLVRAALCGTCILSIYLFYAVGAANLIPAYGVQ